jgi:hypothetical protein
VTVSNPDGACARLATACALAAGIALTAAASAAAQAPARPAPPPPPAALPLAPSATAKTWTEANRRYETTYKTSKEHYEALKRQAGGGLQNPAWDKLPDWSGIWTAANAVSFDPAVRPRNNPAYGPLTPAYQAQYDKTLAEVAKGVEWDALSYCLPAGYPRWLSEPFLREFIPTRTQVLLMNEMVNETRRVYTDGRDHPPEDESFPLWEGHSVGFWDGDVLVVHTNSLRDGDYHRSGPRYSSEATTVEQWRRIDPETMEVWITVYDPPALTKPWHVVRRFTRVNTPGARLDQWVCEENNNVVNQSGVTNFVLPGEQGYKDPNTFGQQAPASN